MFGKKRRTIDPKFLAELRKIPCVICGFKKTEVHHIRTRGAGGGDDPHNCVPICRMDHIKIHSMGLLRMCDLYPHFFNYLQALGWYYDGTEFKNDKNQGA